MKKRAKARRWMAWAVAAPGYPPEVHLDREDALRDKDDLQDNIADCGRRGTPRVFRVEIREVLPRKRRNHAR